MRHLDQTGFSYKADPPLQLQSILKRGLTCAECRRWLTYLKCHQRWRRHRYKLIAFLTALEQIGYYAYDKVSANTASSKPQGYKKSDGSQDARREYPDIPNEPTD